MRAEPPHLGRRTALEASSDAEQRWREGCPVAIEVERSAKTPQRLPAILYGLARRYEAIWYFCTKALEEPLRQSFAQLDAAARRKFSLILLPRERAGAAGQPTTPPPPTDDAPRSRG